MAIRNALVLAIAFAALTVTCSVSAATFEYDLAADWSTVENPFGQWSLRKSASAQYGSVQADFWSDGSNQLAWADNSYPATDHVPFWFKTTAVPAPDRVSTVDVQMGDVLAQPGEIDRTGTDVTSAVWTSPSTGSVTVSGAVWSVTEFNRATRWALRKNEVEFTGGQLTSDGTFVRSSPFSFSLGSGGSSVLHQTVQVGDRIELVLQALTEGGNISDILGIRMQVTLTIGATINGDFELGNQGFSTAHQYSPGNLWSAATYDISTDPRLSHPYAASYGDHTSGSGYMMVLNGVEGSQATAWQQTIDVLPNTVYRIGFFVSSWTPDTFAQLDIVCNGASLGVFMAPTSAGQWQEHYVLWPSELSSTLSYQIVNRNPDGSDYALDDISVIVQGDDPEPTSCMAAPGTPLAWWSLDEQSGLVATDNIGMSAGAMVNGTTWDAGLVCSSARFDGSDDYIEVPDSDLWAFGTADFTIELWANWDSPPAGTLQNPGACLVGNDEGGGDHNKWVFQASSGVLSFHINDGVLGPQWFPIVTFNPVLGAWYHLAITRLGDLYTIYVGGYPRGTAINAREIYNPVAPLTIGQAEGQGFMNGRIDELTIYNRALTGDEIQGIARAEQYGKCKNANRPVLSDVPADQGGMLSVGWKGHAWDFEGAPIAVTSYDLQRYGSGWASIASVVAAYADSYSVVVPTTDIQVIGQLAPYSRYRLVARTADTEVYFASQPDSAYSIDNLPPSAPPLELFDSDTYRYLNWQNPTDADFGQTCLYRGDTPGFEGDEPLACSATQFWYQETDLNRYWYRARSFDIHGNASEWSNEVVGRYPTGVLGTPTALHLYPNQPNPFNPMTTLRFDVPVGGRVRLEVYDVAGRLIRTLLDADLPAGSHQAVWDGKDAASRGMPSGSYFARLSASGRVETVRMGLVK